MQKLVHECIHLYSPPSSTAWELVPGYGRRDRCVTDRLLWHVEEVRTEQYPHPVREVQRQTRGSHPLLGTFIPHIPSPNTELSTISLGPVTQTIAGEIGGVAI